MQFIPANRKEWTVSEAIAMTALSTFDGAYENWLEQPVEIVAGSAHLLEVSEDLVHLQDEIGPRLKSFRETHSQPPQEPIARWADGMTWLMLRHVRTLRRLVQRGHQQVATRATLDSTLRFKAVWDAYRAATNT